MFKTKKEYVFVTSITLFFISQVMDRINGPLVLKLETPYAFINLKHLSTYPFTAVSILLKVIASWLFFNLVLSLLDKKYTLKIAVILVTAILAQLYAIQQMATGLKVTPAEWTLALAFTGLVLLPTSIFFLLAALTGSIKQHTKLPTHPPISQPTVKLPKPKPLKSPKSFDL